MEIRAISSERALQLKAKCPDEDATRRMLRQVHGKSSATGSPEPEDAEGRVGEEPLTDMSDRHTSHKAGSRSIGKKESDRIVACSESMPEPADV